MKDDGDGEGAVRFETRGMCLKFWCQLPVREIWHPIKPQVMGAANRAPQNKVPKFQTLGQVFEVKEGLAVPALASRKLMVARGARGALLHAWTLISASLHVPSP